MRNLMKMSVLLLILAGLALLGHSLSERASASRVEEGRGLVVIDSGHGGKDPGKVGCNDVLEKEVNLSIAKKVKKELEDRKIQVIMTRTKDQEVEEGEAGSRKVQDMKARVALINEAKPDLAVSIHQNSYSDADAEGAQIFYYTHSADGERLADRMEEALRDLKDTRVRESKANDTYYLLRRTEVPCLIIECGFLSNAREAERLSDQEYQQEMAEAIANGIDSCMEK